MKNRRTARVERRPEWVVTVRLSNGATLYYSGQGRIGQEWTPHSAQAEKFESGRDAHEFADACQTNSEAKEYAVVSVGQQRP